MERVSDSEVSPLSESLFRVLDSGIEASVDRCHRYSLNSAWLRSCFIPRHSSRLGRLRLALLRYPGAPPSPLVPPAPPRLWCGLLFEGGRACYRSGASALPQLARLFVGRPRPMLVLAGVCDGVGRL